MATAIDVHLTSCLDPFPWSLVLKVTILRPLRVLYMSCTSQLLPTTGAVRILLSYHRSSHHHIKENQLIKLFLQY